MTPSDRLRELALRSGFDRVGIASLDRATTGESFLRWLADGAQAGMGYLERRVEVRLDPRQLLPGARSAICVALRYWPLGVESDASNDLWPGVARYARGRDYHDLMLDRLKQLEEEIRDEFPGSLTRRYVDTGPVLERDLAARAGLGSFGKNTNLLNPDMGSWFLLGEILTTLELPSDSAVADLCGTCSLCLEACPTGALTEAYKLDSRLCISYWTIEHRGSIPAGMRPEVGSWVFGCDVCQEVCPANAELGAASHPELEPPDQRKDLSLTGLLGMSREEYVEAFRGSAMKRSKLSGLKRNAAIVMGNSGDSRYSVPLLAALRDDDAMLREHAAWALGRIAAGGGLRDRAVRDALEMSLETESDPEVRAELGAALAAAGAAAGPDRA